jgi:hypothetical protein
VKIIRHDELSEDFFDYKEIEEIGAVQDIISEVRRVGDRAIKKYTLKFDGVELEQFKISTSEIKQAYDLLDNDMIASLELAAANIRRFAIKQREQLTDFDYEILPGVVTGQRVIPIERVGWCKRDCGLFASDLQWFDSSCHCCGGRYLPGGRNLLYWRGSGHCGHGLWHGND